MANIRKRGDKWQVKIQRTGLPGLYQTFAKKSDAAVWARQIEASIDWDHPFGKNPVDLIRKPKIPPGRTRRLIPGELQKMREGMETSESTYLMPMIEFAIETAMRRGEILALEWKNIDFRTLVVCSHRRPGWTGRWPPSAAWAIATTAPTCARPPAAC